MDGDKKVVLFVDDNKDFLTLAEEELESEEYELRTLLVPTDTAGFVDKIAEMRPDLIFLDVMFSKKFSNAMATEIRKQPPLAEVPVYLMSFLDIAEIALIANKKEVNGCFQKPIKRADIAMLFKKHFGLTITVEED